MRRFSYLLSIFFVLYSHGVTQDLSEKYITCQAYGQLGNQLSIVATTLGLAWDNGATAIFPLFKNEKRWNVQHNCKNFFFRLDFDQPKNVTFNPVNLSFYKKVDYQKNIMLKKFDIRLDYFERYIDRLRKLFAPSEGIEDYLQKHYSEILDAPNTVGMHLRVCSKGSYPFSGWKYFEEAMALFPKDSLFIVCSDRISWVKKHFPHKTENVIFIEENDYLIDFFLLSKCKNNITCASTFGYWAALLNDNLDKKVIAPSLWLAHKRKLNLQGFPAKFDVYPKDWIILNVPLKRSIAENIKEHPSMSTDW